MTAIKQRVYIAGAVKGLPFEEVKAKFSAAAEKLEALGYLTVNPVEHIETINRWRVNFKKKAFSDNSETDRIEIIKLCFRAMEECQFIYFLPCAKHSEGAAKEKIYSQLINVHELVLECRHDFCDWNYLATLHGGLSAFGRKCKKCGHEEVTKEYYEKQ